MSKFVDSILGHAIGDAMGMPTEFCIRERLIENPVSEDKVIKINYVRSFASVMTRLLLVSPLKKFPMKTF